MTDVAAIHLDTSFLIRALLPGTPEATRLESWLVGRSSLSISAMAWAEFLSGPLDEGTFEVARRLLGEASPVTGPDAEQAARLFNRTGRRRGSLADCLIAAVAMGASARLAATDAGFARFSGDGLELATDS